MKLKLKDIILCVEHVRKSTDAENVDVFLDEDHLEIEYMSRDRQLETVSCFPFERKQTPQHHTVVKLYDKP